MQQIQFFVSLGRLYYSTLYFHPGLLKRYKGKDSMAYKKLKWNFRNANGSLVHSTSGPFLASGGASGGFFLKKDNELLQLAWTGSLHTKMVHLNTVEGVYKKFYKSSSLLGFTKGVPGVYQIFPYGGLMSPLFQESFIGKCVIVCFDNPLAATGGIG